MSSLLIQNGQLVTEQGIQRYDLLIENGIITTIEPEIRNQKPETPPDSETIDASNLLIFPGLIDCHVHFREPGYPEAEDMESGSISALHGGITTVCEMPNTNPPTSTAEALEYKRSRAQNILKSGISCLGSSVHGPDIRFFFGVTCAQDLHELTQVNPEDICGVKVYLDHSTGDRKVEEGILHDLFAYCALKKIVVVAHCEDPQMNEAAKRNCTRDDIAAHSMMRPPESEAKAIETAILIAQNLGTHLHIAHLSTASGLHLVAEAKADHLPVTCEVAPHHLFLSTDDYKRLGTFGKMNPPLRESGDREALWQGIEEGIVDCIATDHAPHTLEAKHRKPALTASSGVPGIETMLPLFLSLLHGGPQERDGKRRSFGVALSPTTLLRLCHTSPNRIFNLGKPGIYTSKPVDLCLVNPLEKWTISGKDLHSRCGWTPYEGWKVTGKVVRVIR